MQEDWHILAGRLLCVIEKLITIHTQTQVSRDGSVCWLVLVFCGFVFFFR